jgi:hypothetical protein
MAPDTAWLLRTGVRDRVRETAVAHCPYAWATLSADGSPDNADPATPVGEAATLTSSRCVTIGLHVDRSSSFSITRTTVHDTLTESRFRRLQFVEVYL